MPGQRLEQEVKGQDYKESFPNAEIGARLLRINGRFISVLPKATPRLIGETYLGHILGLNGWLVRYKDEVNWRTDLETLEVRASTTSYGGRFFKVVPTNETSRNGVRVERLHVNEMTKDVQWEEVLVNGEHPVYPGFSTLGSAYWPEDGLLKSVPTVTLSEIIRVSRGRFEGFQHFLFEATFASVPNKTGNLENCNASSSYQPIEEPVVLEK